MVAILAQSKATSSLHPSMLWVGQHSNLKGTTLNMFHEPHQLLNLLAEQKLTCPPWPNVVCFQNGRVYLLVSSKSNHQHNEEKWIATMYDLSLPANDKEPINHKPMTNGHWLCKYKLHWFELHTRMCWLMSGIPVCKYKKYWQFW